jgi:hypothetical protein
MKLPLLTYAQCCEDPNLFGGSFSGPSWAAWRVMDRALFGEPLTAEQLEIFTSLTGRTEAPTEPCREAWFGFGRRSAKDQKAASIVTYLATLGAELFGFREKLSPGERGVVPLLAVDRDQAGVCMEYTKAFFEKPLFAQLVQRMTSDSIELKNRITIDIMTSDQRRIRGRTVIAAVLDEVAHWKSDTTANPDESIYEALLPSLATMGGGMVIGISSPHMRRGLLYRKITEHWAKPGPILVAKAPTWVMNPTLPRESGTIAAAYARNPSWADAEYGANWRADLEGYVSIDVVRSLIKEGVYERRPERGNRYYAYCDPSGGVGDSMTLAIAHRAADTTILDCIREAVAPFDPEAITAEFADVCRSYRVKRLVGDKFGAEWVKSAFRKCGITYVNAETSTTQNYLNLLPILNSGEVDLLDSSKLVAQLTSLERRPRRGAHDSVDHPRDMHDDIATAVAGVCSIIDGSGLRYPLDRERPRPLMVESTGGNYNATSFARAY